MTTKLHVIILIALGLFGLLGFLYGVWELVQARASLQWVPAEAVVTDARVRIRRGRYASYIPDITYRYNYQGREYVGRRIAFWGAFLLANPEAESLVERFAVGTRWEVRVCEARPHQSVLHPGVTSRLWFSLAFSGVFLFVSMMMLIRILPTIE